MIKCKYPSCEEEANCAGQYCDICYDRFNDHHCTKEEDDDYQN